MDANRELIDALNQIEKEKDISKEILLEALENSLVAACKNNFGKADNIKVSIDRETGQVNVYAMKEVVEEVTDPVTQISLAQAKIKDGDFNLGDMVSVEVTPKNFGTNCRTESKTGCSCRKSVKKKERYFISSTVVRKEIL